MKQEIDKLAATHILTKEEFLTLLTHYTEKDCQYLFTLARHTTVFHYGTKIYCRGLIEFTNYCKNDCLYCGIRHSNTKAQRFRLTKEEILSCCKTGYHLGLRTFVLQGGEDCFFTVDKMAEIISSIHKSYPDCAITLSIGEKSKEEYQQFFDAGADRFLLRHETSNELHYKKLHPPAMDCKNRKECLFHLKEIGYQVGTGFLVGSPFQTLDHIAEDLLFIKELSPHMVGIGPFIPHRDTPFKNNTAGSSDLTLFLIGILRLMLPNALIPATTALSTITEQGWRLGILAGANVVMPNLSPVSVRQKYALYNNKKHSGSEAAEHITSLRSQFAEIGCQLVTDRGDYKQKKEDFSCQTN